MSGFVKLIMPASFNYTDGMPLASLVDVHSSGIDSQWLTKRAAAGVFKDVDIKPEKGQAYIHLIAMGDSEAYGQNRNGDIFYKQSRLVDIPNPAHGVSKQLRINKGNKETHHTFQKYAKVYRNHCNRDPKKAEGEVVKSAHNDEMSRVELIIKVPEDKWSDDLHKIANGEDTTFSMACKIP